MLCLNVVDVDDGLVEELWEKVSTTGSFYSIGDGVAKATFRKVLFQSNFVLRGSGVTVRVEEWPKFVEIHPVVFGPSVFAYAKDMLADVGELRDRYFAGKSICVIIPDRMKGAKRLALRAGMTKTGEVMRDLSGVQIKCSVFSWR